MENRIKELRDLVVPIMKYVKKRYPPNSKVIIDENMAEVILRKREVSIHNFDIPEQPKEAKSIERLIKAADEALIDQVSEDVLDAIRLLVRLFMSPKHPTGE